jgi:leucyl aminopeptidase (aminopeptidase T)
MATEPTQGPETAAVADLRSAIRDLFQVALSADPSDEVLIICDESFERYERLFTSVAMELGLSFAFLYMPNEQQRYLARKITTDRSIDWLPRPIKIAVNSASITINALSGSLTTSAVRRAILQQPRLRDARLAHMPGVSDDVLLIVARTDFRQILTECEMLAWFLGNAKSGTIDTTTASGRTCTLTLELGGWDNEPLMSPGIIPAGSWGNFPPGEVFCCPSPTGVNGEVNINGSVPGLILSPGEDVVLKFEEGRLAQWSTQGSEAVDKFFLDLKRSSEERGDVNWKTFAELGIGLNPAIQTLTGNPLFDEKAAATLHVAVGDNTTFGATIKSDIHVDLVTWHPTLRLDGIEVMTRGSLQLNSLRRYRSSWVPTPANLPPTARLWLKEAEIHTDGGIMRRRLARAGRVGYVQMADDRIGSALAVLAERLRRLENVSIQELLEHQPKIDGYPTERLLDWLEHYQCLIVST